MFFFLTHSHALLHHFRNIIYTDEVGKMHGLNFHFINNGNCTMYWKERNFYNITFLLWKAQKYTPTVITLNLLNFLNRIIHLSLLEMLGVSIIIFRDIRMKLEVDEPTLYRTWSDYTNIQAGLALYWWQRLITFGSSRVMG